MLLDYGLIKAALSSSFNINMQSNDWHYVKRGRLQCRKRINTQLQLYTAFSLFFEPFSLHIDCTVESHSSQLPPHTQLLTFKKS